MAENSPIQLTCNQVNILILLSQGYTQEYTAHFLEKSRYTISNEVKKIINCMNAKNLAHAIALAISTDTIPHPPLPTTYRTRYTPTNLIQKSSLSTTIEGLTEREREIFDILGDNLTVELTNNAIAKRLNITPFTVKKHLTNLYKKLGVSGRSGAINYANQWKYIQMEKQNAR